MSGPWDQFKAQTPTGAPWEQFGISQAEDQATTQQVSRFQFIANEAKKGTVDSAVLGQAILDTFVIDPFKKLYAEVTGKPSAAPGGVMERFGRNVKRLEKAAQPLTGADYEMKAPDEVTRVLASGARFVTDPLGYVALPVKTGETAVRATLETGKAIAQRAPTLFGAGATAELGGKVGETVEKAITGEDTGTGRALGSITGAVKGSYVGTALSTAVTAPVNVGKQVYDKYKTVKADPDAASEVLSSTAAKRLLEAIAKETPGNKLDDIVNDFNRISQNINKENLPLMVAMSDNPIVRAEITRLAKTNPEMRQRIETELQRLALNIDERADLIFGKRYTPVVGADQVSVKNALKRREEIDNKIFELSEAYIPNVSRESIGDAITNLVDARVKAARQEMSPVYDAITADAKKAGAKLPDTAVRDVYNFVVANNLRDVFGKGTAVDKKIMKEWGPTNIGFAPVSFDQVDSLKREINRLQRGSLAPNEARKLNQLEDVLDNARTQIPGNFSDRLRAADLAYYEKVGVPFGAQGIKDIDSKKYAEQVAPVLLKNASAVRQFLRAVGDEGTSVVRNTIISDVANKAFTNGALDPRKLQSYLNKNKDLLDQVPAIREELRQSIFDVGRLNIAKQQIDDSVKAVEKELADNFVISVKDAKGVSVPDYKSITDKMLRDPSFYAKINKDISRLDPASSKAVKNSIKREIIETARNFPDGGVAFLTDPRNKKTIEGVFGAGYQGAIKDLVKLSDALKTADVARLSSVVTQGDLDTLAKYAADIGAPGLDLPYVTSTIRDRISSVPQKVVRIVTRVNTAKTREYTDDAIFDLLTNKDGIEQLRKVTKELDLKIKNPVSFKKMVDKAAELMPLYVYGAGKATINPVEEVGTESAFPMGGFEEQ
jgi:hypothetical protein